MPQGGRACLSCLATAERPHHAAPRRPGRHWVEATTEAELVEAVGGRRRRRRAGAGARRRQQPGGRRRRVRRHGRRRSRPADRADLDADDDGPSCSGATVTVAAGEDWDDLVARAVERGWVGIEALVRDPGLGRRHPDPERRRLRPGGLPDRSPRCGSGTGGSAAYAPSPPPTAASATAPAASRPTRAGTSSSTSPSSSALGTLGAPVAYAELARTLGVEVGQRAPLSRRPRGGAALRRGKGMVLDAADHDTWSAGLVLHQPGARRPATGSPTARRRWPQPDGTVKTSAAWLIEHAGFGKGLRRRAGPPLDQAHPRPDQPRRRPPPPTCSPWPARCATASTRVRHHPGQRAGPRRRRALGRERPRHAVTVASDRPARRSMSRQPRGRPRRRAPGDAANDIRASSASSASVSSWAARMVAYCAGELRAEQQRVVGAEGDGGAGVEQLRAAAPTSGRSRRRARRWRRGRPRARRRARRSGPAAPGPPPTGRRGRAGRRAARRGRSGRLRPDAARRRAAPAPGRPARRSGTPAAKSAVLPRRSSLERPKPTTPRPAYCAASRASVRASSGCRVRLAAITTAMPSPVRSRGVPDAVEHQVGERGDPAEARGVAARVDLDLQPAAAVADVVLGGLQHQAAYVVGRAQHRPRDVVEPLEAEPALLVGRRQLRRPVRRPASRAARCRPGRPARAGWRAASTP